MPDRGSRVIQLPRRSCVAVDGLDPIRVHRPSDLVASQSPPPNAGSNLGSLGRGIVVSCQDDDIVPMHSRASIVVVLAVIAGLMGIDAAPAAPAASPEATYMATMRKQCRQMTLVAADRMRAFAQAKAAGQKRAAGVAFVQLMVAGSNAYVRMLGIAVPPALAGRMLSVRRNMVGQVEAIRGITEATTDAEYRTHAGRLDALATAADALFDAVGLADCGSRQSRAVTAASRG